MSRDSNPTALQMLEDAKFDLFDAEACVVRAQDDSETVHVGSLKAALHHLANLRQRAHRLELMIEEECGL